MSASGRPRPRYELTYRFVKRGDSSSIEYPVTVETATNDTARHKEAAYRHLARMLGVSSVAEVRRDWTPGATGVAFANAPWSDWDDLERALAALPGVQNLRYDPPRIDDYHPPRFVLNVEGGRADAVRLAVSQYYGGLAPMVKNGRTVVVVVNPLR